MRVSNSKLKTWKRCPRQYKFKYIEKLEPKAKSIQLERGTWIHALLEEHYNGNDWRVKHKELTIVFNNYFEEQREELGDLPNECARIMRSYLRYWAEDDKHLVVIDSEMDEIVMMPNGLELQIIIDLIVEDTRTGLLWPWDHKTRKNFESSDMMLIDPQLTLYFKGLEMMGYTNLGGVVYNELRTKPPTVPQQLKAGGLSKAMNIDTDLWTYRTELKRLDLDESDYSDILRHIARNQTERFFRRTKLPKDPPMTRIMSREVMQTARQIAMAEKREEYPRTFSAQQCKWDCDFKNLCIAELHGADYESMLRSSFRKRGPRGSSK